MLKVIRKIPVLQHSISKEDLEKIKFPTQVKEISDIRLVNEDTGRVLTLEDREFTYATNVRGQEGDRILITFIKDDLPNIRITIEISEIYQYTTQLDIWVIPKYQGARIDVMDHTYYITKENPSKYFILIYEDWFTAHANKVVIKDAVYIE